MPPRSLAKNICYLIAADPPFASGAPHQEVCYQACLPEKGDKRHVGRATEPIGINSLVNGRGLVLFPVRQLPRGTGLTGQGWDAPGGMIRGGDPWQSHPRFKPENEGITS